MLGVCRFNRSGRCSGATWRGRPGPVVRALGSLDLTTVARVWHEGARSSDGAPCEVPPLSALRRRIDVELANGWSLSVAEEDRQIVGMLALKKAAAVLDQIYVLPSARRKGIGRLLLRHAMHEMPRGFGLRTAAENEGARVFYEREGLVRLSTGKHPRHGRAVCYYGWNVSSRSF